MRLQQWRNVTKIAFFLLFLFAPLLDIFRFDLELGHFIIFTQPWTLSIEHILAGDGDAVDAAIRIFTRVILPGIGFFAVTGWLIWKFGRIYCGWLCPHFSVVELINQLMLKQLSRVTLWEKPNKTVSKFFPKFIVFITAFSMAFVWAVGLLSYLLDPKALLIDFVHFNLGFGSSVFISVATTIFTLDFIFARHVFCKYGCALGLFQSLIWMANKQAMVVKFDRKRAKACRECALNQSDKPCDQACPMRLPTRNMKRAKFTCTQCAQCISACQQVQENNPQGSLLSWVQGSESKEVDRPAAKFEDLTTTVKQPKRISIKEIN